MCISYCNKQGKCINQFINIVKCFEGCNTCWGDRSVNSIVQSSCICTSPKLCPCLFLWGPSPPITLLWHLNTEVLTLLLCSLTLRSAPFLRPWAVTNWSSCLIHTLHAWPHLYCLSSLLGRGTHCRRLMIPAQRVSCSFEGLGNTKNY